MQTGPQPYGEFFVSVGDKNLFGIDFEGWLINRWIRARNVVLGQLVRPSIANGFEYVCTVAGQTGNYEPLIWPAIANATIADGGAVWTAQPASTASLSTTVQSAAWTPPAGVSVANAVVTGQLASAAVDFTGASAGSDYMVKVVATLNDGETKTGRIKFKVR